MFRYNFLLEGSKVKLRRPSLERTEDFFIAWGGLEIQNPPDKKKEKKNKNRHVTVKVKGELLPVPKQSKHCLASKISIPTCPKWRDHRFFLKINWAFNLSVVTSACPSEQPKPWRRRQWAHCFRGAVGPFTFQIILDLLDNKYIGYIIFRSLVYLHLRAFCCLAGN